jgi:hypothetical protein
MPTFTDSDNFTVISGAAVVDGSVGFYYVLVDDFNDNALDSANKWQT